jgi:hypothetical protein
MCKIKTCNKYVCNYTHAHINVNQKQRKNVVTSMIIYIDDIWLVDPLKCFAKN